MCLRFIFLLITHMTSWLRLSHREDAWKTTENLILRHHLAVQQWRQLRRPNLNWTDRPTSDSPEHQGTGPPPGP